MKNNNRTLKYSLAALLLSFSLSGMAAAPVEEASHAMQSVGEGAVEAADTAANVAGQVGENVGNAIDDTRIVTSINLSYSKNPLLNPLSIEVTSDNGVVTLVGAVKTDAEYEQAVMLAESTDGVTNVNADELTVSESVQPVTDTYITAKVKGKILKEKVFGDQDIKFWTVNVETKEGTIYLTGEVETAAQKSNLEKIAASVSNDVSVNADGLKVKNQ